MTRDRLDDVPIEDEDDFETVLAELVERALESDVDVYGAWAFETPESTDNWEVEVVELAQDLDDTDD